MTEEPDLWVGAQVRYVGADQDGPLRAGVRGRVTEVNGGGGGTPLAVGARPPLRRGEVQILLEDGQTVVAGIEDVELLTPPHVLRPEAQSAEARWLLDVLRPWTSGEQTLPVASFVPETFPAVVKVLHHWAGPEGDAELTWEQVADQAGLRSLQALSQTRLAEGPPEVQGWRSPPQGQMDHRTAAGLVAVLQAATDTPEDVFVAVWTGWGGFPYQRFAGAVVLPTEARGHRLLRGPLTGVLQPVSDHAEALETSGIWWPADRSWVVVTEVDFEWTFVAGSQALMDQLANHSDLEVLHTDMDAPANRLDQDRPA